MSLWSFSARNRIKKQTVINSRSFNLSAGKSNSRITWTFSRVHLEVRVIDISACANLTYAKRLLLSLFKWSVLYWTVQLLLSYRILRRLSLMGNQTFIKQLTSIRPCMAWKLWHFDWQLKRHLTLFFLHWFNKHFNFNFKHRTRFCKKNINAYWDIFMFTYCPKNNGPEQLVSCPNALRCGCFPGD